MITLEVRPDLRDVLKFRESVMDANLFKFYNGHMRYSDIFCFRVEDMDDLEDLEAVIDEICLILDIRVEKKGSEIC